MARLKGLDAGEIEESGIRLARLSRLTGDPLIVDATATEDGRADDDWMRTFLAAAGGEVIRPRQSQVIRRAWSGCSGLHPI